MTGYNGGARAVIPRHFWPGDPATVNNGPSASSNSADVLADAVRFPEVP